MTSKSTNNKNSALKKAGLPIAIFAVMGAVTLLASSFAGDASPRFSVDEAELTGIRLTNDSDAFGGKSIVFAESNDDDPVVTDPNFPGDDGLLGGQAPWTPARANYDFNDIADASGITTVDAGCSGVSADCAAKIKAAMNSTAQRPLKVTFGNAQKQGDRVALKSPITLKDDVYIEGINQPILEIHKNGALFSLSGRKNVSIRGFDMDLRDCASRPASFFSIASPAENIFLSDIKVINAERSPGNHCEMSFVSNTGGGESKNIYLYDIEADNLRRIYHAKAKIDSLSILNSTFTNLGRSVYEQTARGVNDLHFEGNIFSKHAAKTVTSHFIGTPLSRASGPITYTSNVIIRNNLVEGRPNVAHIKYCPREGFGITNCPIDTITKPNGGSADLIALRGTDGFVIEGNVVRHGGEVGLTMTAGLKNGVIRHNQVSYTDTTAIVLGNEARWGNEAVANIDVHDNEFFRNALDRPQEFHAKSQRPPVFSLWNAKNTCIVRNNIHDNTVANGFWVYNGNTATWPASVFDAHINLNVLENNFRDFVQGRNHREDVVEPAVQTGGENWTAIFPGVDSDKDGLPNHCFTEVNNLAPYGG